MFVGNTTAVERLLVGVGDGRVTVRAVIRRPVVGVSQTTTRDGAAAGTAISVSEGGDMLTLFNVR